MKKQNMSFVWDWNEINELEEYNNILQLFENNSMKFVILLKCMVLLSAEQISQKKAFLQK